MPYYWSTYIDNDAYLLRIPSIKIMAGHVVTTPAYYHDRSTRLDEPHFVFQYTLKGEGRFRYDGVEHRLSAGHGFFCNTHDPKMAYYYPPEGKEPYELLFCIFKGDIAVFEEIVAQYGRVYSISEESQAIQQMLKYRTRGGDHLNSVKMPVSQSVKMAASLLAQFIECGELQQETKAVPLVKKVKTYIFEHIEEKIAIQSLAQFCDVSASHLSRVFKSEVGLSPQNYIDNLRMQHAMKLLKSSPLSIKEIAYRMGFAIPAHFTRSFKRVHGITPGQARKSL